MFGLSLRREHHDEPEDYTKELSSWQLRHGADRNDLTPDQRQRLRLHNLSLNAGLDPNRVTYVGWLVRTGRCSDER